MSYTVVAGYVTVQTKLEKGRAYIDIPRGDVVPADVPEAETEWLLRLGYIEETDPKPEPDPEPDPEPGEGEELDGLEKDDLLKIASDEDIEVDKRWGAEKLAAAIREHRQ